MLAPPPRLFPALLSLVVAGAFAASPATATAGLLDEPPTLCTFKLDDPGASRLPLLAAFHEAEAARPAPRYLRGPWARWGGEPWWTLTWSRNASHAGVPAAGHDGATEGVASSTGGLALGLDPQAASPGVEGGAPSLEDVTRLVAQGVASLSGADARGPGTSRLSLGPETAPTWLGRLDPDWSPLLASTGTTFASNGFDALWAPMTKPKPDWRCRRRPIRFVRFGAESDSFALLRCDGSVAPEALDRLTLMARPPEVAHPRELLSDEPDERVSVPGEWEPGVRVVNPRVLWLLQRIADAFPWRTVYVFSGYRPMAPGAKPGSHHSLHGEARAMDINVMGIPNVALFKFCRTLDDVGCGFYPNGKFVHVDVRAAGSAHPFWIDISGPGEPSRYVDAWPGVVESGGLAWDARHASDSAPLGTDASCVTRH